VTYARAVADRSRDLIERSEYSRPGFAEQYDRARPAPPGALLDLLCRLALVDRPRLVVDIGCGTGLSTRVWSDRADAVIGVEPNADMLARAELATAAPNVSYTEGYSNATGIEDGEADIVTCSQSLHWMEPDETFAEAARILRPGGVFAAYDYDLPPSVHPEVDAAFDAYQRRRGEVRRARDLRMGAECLPLGKEGHLERMRASGRFRVCRELLVHAVDHADAVRMVGLARSIGPSLEEETADAIEQLREVCVRVLGSEPTTWHVGYRVRAGIR
jgi:SAM-dependent methyltransferase